MSKDMQVRTKGVYTRGMNSVFPSNYKNNLSSGQKIQEFSLSLSLSNLANQAYNVRLLLIYLVSALMYYFIFNLRHLEYSSQYVVMQRFILILFPKCLTLPAAPLCSLFLYCWFKAKLFKELSLLRDLIFSSFFFFHKPMAVGCQIPPFHSNASFQSHQ